MSYPAVLHCLLAEFHLTSGQVLAAITFSSSALLRAETVLPSSSQLYLLSSFSVFFFCCLPPHVLFFLLLFFFLSVWRDDVKLKNGVSWWADGGGRVTKLFHVNISILLCLYSTKLTQKKKRFQSCLSCQDALSTLNKHLKDSSPESNF